MSVEKIPYVTNQCFGVVCVQPVTSAGLAKNGRFLSYDNLAMNGGIKAHDMAEAVEFCLKEM